MARGHCGLIGLAQLKIIFVIWLWLTTGSQKKKDSTMQQVELCNHKALINLAQKSMLCFYLLTPPGQTTHPLFTCITQQKFKCANIINIIFKTHMPKTHVQIVPLFVCVCSCVICVCECLFGLMKAHPKMQSCKGSYTQNRLKYDA